MFYFSRRIQKSPVQSKKSQNKHTAPEIITCAADPQHCLSKADREPPQKGKNEKQNKNIIFLPAVYIHIHKQCQGNKHETVHHIEHMLADRQGKPDIELPDDPSAV